MAFNNKDLGRLYNPVQCSGERGMRLYFCALLDDNGLPLTIERRDHYVLDGRELEVLDVLKSDGSRQSIYFDMHHVGYHETSIIEGFKTHKDFIQYKEFTHVKYFNRLLKTLNFPDDFSSFFILWKNCGVLLSFGPGFYATNDREGMPLPVFKMPELMKSVGLVVHTLAGLTPEVPLPFVKEKYLREFLATFYYELLELKTYPSSETSSTQRIEARNKYSDDMLVLWVDVPLGLEL
jgi:hypothetical protein